MQKVRGYSDCKGKTKDYSQKHKNAQKIMAAKKAKLAN